MMMVFAGHHGYWPGIGRGLYRTEAVFRDTVIRCDEFLNRRFELVKYFEAAKPNLASSSDELEASVFAIQAVTHFALSELCRHKGITTDATLGCSLGVMTSALTTEALTLEDALRVVSFYTCGAVPRNAVGKLILLSHDLIAAQAIVKKCPIELRVAVEHGPSETILSCGEADLNAVCSFLNLNKLNFSVYPGLHGGHTQFIERAGQPSLESMRDIIPSPARFPFYSSFGGAVYPEGVSFDETFWFWQVAEPCLFNSAFEQALHDQYDTFLIIGSGVVLGHNMREAAAKLQKDVIILESVNQSEHEEITFSESLATLQEYGFVKPNKPRHRESTQSVLNVDTQDFVQDPYGTYRRLRKQGSVQFLKKQDLWVVLDYDDVSLALMQPEVFSIHTGIEHENVDGLTVVAVKDPLDDSALRQALSPHFAARGMGDIRSYIEQQSKVILEEALTKTEFDVVTDFAVPLSSLVMDRVLRLTDQDTQTVELVGERCGEYHATLLSTCIRILLQHPAVLCDVQKKDGLLPQFVEEVLRFDAPEQVVSRITTCKTQLGGITIPESSHVRLVLGAANRDSKHYRSPELFILNRNPKDHLAFGAGSHYYLGAFLARLQTQVALKTLLQLAPSIFSAPNVVHAKYARTDRFRALKSLPVRV